MSVTATSLAATVLERLRLRSETAVAAGKQAALEAAKTFGPTLETGHPYATGTFVRSLRWHGNKLVSSLDYAYFTDRGFTRAGEGKARRWRERGGIRFGEHYATVFLTVFREAFIRAV